MRDGEPFAIGGKRWVGDLGQLLNAYSATYAARSRIDDLHGGNPFVVEDRADDAIGGPNEGISSIRPPQIAATMELAGRRIPDTQLTASGGDKVFAIWRKR